MKYIYIFSVISVFLALASCNSCNKENEDIDFATEYADADAVYLNITKEYTLNDDGSMTYRYSHRQKLLTFISFNRLYGESFIVYNPEFQTLKIIKAETKMADGTIVPSPENAFNEVLPHEAANAPAFNHLREMVVTHTGLELGAEVTLEYEITSNKDYAPALMGYESFYNACPVREMSLIFNIPADKQFNYKIINDSCQISTEDNKNVKTYKLELKNRVASIHESFVADYSYPGISFSTMLNEDIHKYIKTQEAYKYNVSEDMISYLESLKSEELSLDKASEIQKYVVENINHYPVELKLSAYKVRTPAEVWKSNGGTTSEKTVLLNSLLKKAGYSSKIIFAVPDHVFDNQIGNMDLLSEQYVEVNINDETFYMSAIELNKKNPDFNRENKMFFSDNENLLKRPDNDTASSVISFTGNFTITGSDVKGDVNLVMTNDFLPERNSEKSKDQFGSFVSGAKADFSKFQEVNNSLFSLDYTVNKQNAGKMQSGYYFMPAPCCSRGTSSWHTDYLSFNRAMKFELPEKLNESYDLTYTIPANYTLISKDTLITLNNSAGHLTISFQKKDNQIQIHRSVSFKNKVIQPDQYNDFRNIINCWNNKKWKEIVLKQ